MKHCPTCNRTYTDESLLFCADDGTQLVSEATPAEPLNAPPSSQPTIAYTPTPPASSYQPTPKKRKWLAVTALLLGFFALPFLLYGLILPLFWEFSFRNGSLDRLFLSAWGVATVFGIVLALVSLVAGIVALGVSFKKPAQYGGRLLAAVGPVLSILLVFCVIGVFAFRRMQGSTFDEFISNSNDNSNSSSNYNSTGSSNYNSASNSNYNSNSSDSLDESDDSASMSETDKYRLFYAAAKSGDTSLQQRAAKKVGIVDSNGIPTSTYESFTKGMMNWAFTDSAWVRTIDTPAKARTYAESRL